MNDEPDELALARARIVDLETQAERQQQQLLHYAVDVCPEQDRRIAELQDIIENCLPYLPACSGVERDARKALNPQQEVTGDESAPAMLTRQ